MPWEEEKLRLGKGAAFVKGRLQPLRQGDETWEADFRALPKPITQSRTDYRGMVVAPDGSTLAESQVEGRPTVNVEGIEDKVPRGKFPKVMKKVGKSLAQYADEDE